MAKHIHADLIMAYAKLAQETDRPWEHFEHRLYNYEIWKKCGPNMPFDSFTEYRIVTPIIKIGEIDVPEPVRKPLENGFDYYYPDITQYDEKLYCKRTWRSLRNYDYGLLQKGLIHLDRESAELHARALISLTQK
ncbi:hypothetical protein [Xenorhabdus hominickii]|uniref:Uncharacterized protein n=1 Tax=Xenorhabdus hominickii TaxID=351679 RepID=A0A1D7P3N8_XENHO|nr:hypothetical protein [Xenorhabdus hominickii]AOM39641.1 hypothetical protein A9255_02950 [Xenorhabdus hominickii]AOM40210.1 hypothetical protein A9255_06225 [Xenorhabdus hominickii]PHM48714.1 hypothetical protein Xhom_05029 [Xenorhabdus hominickii]